MYASNYSQNICSEVPSKLILNLFTIEFYHKPYTIRSSIVNLVQTAELPGKRMTIGSTRLYGKYTVMYIFLLQRRVSSPKHPPMTSHNPRRCHTRGTGPQRQSDECPPQWRCSLLTANYNLHPIITSLHL